MHEGKVLQKLVHDDDRPVKEIIAKTGMSRGYIYILYKQASIDPKWKKKFSDIGIVVDSTNVYTNSGHPIKREGMLSPPSANGSGKHITKSKNIEPISTYTEGEGERTMDEIIHLSLTELLKLQEQGDDRGMGKLVTALILLKKDIVALEKENKKLEADKEKLESDKEYFKKLLDKLK